MKMKSHLILTTVFIFAVFFFSSCKTQSPGNEIPAKKPTCTLFNLNLSGSVNPLHNELNDH